MFKQHFIQFHREKALGVILTESSDLMNENQGHQFNQNVLNNQAAGLIYNYVAPNIASFTFGSSFNEPSHQQPFI